VLPVLGVLAVQAAVLAGIFILASSGEPPARLRGRDAVTLPGGSLSLRVEVEREDPPFPWMHPFRGRAVLFERIAGDTAGSGAPVGLAEIDASVAELPISAPAEPGLHRYRARVRETAGFEHPEADIVVASVPPERGLVLVMLPQDPDVDRFFRKGGAGEVDAPGALQSLAADRSIVYVARRLPRGGRAWIASLGFPPGPMLVSGKDRGKLEKLLASLGLERWKGRCAAVATSPEDATALSIAGARVILLGGGGGAGLPLVRSAEHWSEAARLVKEQGQG
jgi:hypothetical protein